MMDTIAPSSFRHSVHDEPTEDWTIEELLQWCHLQSQHKIQSKTEELVHALQQLYSHAERDIWELHKMAVEADREDNDDDDDDDEENGNHGVPAAPEEDQVTCNSEDHESISTLTSASVTASIAKSLTPMQMQHQNQNQGDGNDDENIPPNVNATLKGGVSVSVSGSNAIGVGVGVGGEDVSSNATRKATKGMQGGKSKSTSATSTATATATAKPKRRRHNNLHVEILTGPHANETFLLKPRTNRPCDIGRSKGKKFRERGISLYMDSEVSTCHGKFEMKPGAGASGGGGGNKAGSGGGGKITYTDTGSTNGTSYMGEALEDYVPLELEDGMVLCFGESELRFTIVEA